jgi:hypothetical protein
MNAAAAQKYYATGYQDAMAEIASLINEGGSLEDVEAYIGDNTATPSGKARKV